MTDWTFQYSVFEWAGVAAVELESGIPAGMKKLCETMEAAAQQS